MASGLLGSSRKTRRRNRSMKTSGFQAVHLWSSIETSEIICWNVLSPVFSFTHWMPFGEKMEKPDEDPACEVSHRIITEEQGRGGWVLVPAYRYTASLRCCW